VSARPAQRNSQPRRKQELHKARGGPGSLWLRHPVSMAILRVRTVSQLEIPPAAVGGSAGRDADPVSAAPGTIVMQHSETDRASNDNACNDDEHEHPLVSLICRVRDPAVSGQSVPV
jgi:hypothetical protein